MNILLTLRQPLVPADTGGKVRSLNIFSRLAKRASIHAVSFADPVHEAAPIAEMKHIFESYTPVAWHESTKYSPAFYAEVLASQLGSWPYFLSKCNRLEFVSTVRVLARRHRFDLLFCDFLHTAAPLVSFPFAPKIVFEHNVEFLLRKRKCAVETNPIRRTILKNEWMKTRVIEKRVCRNCDGLLVVSEDDRQTMLREFGVANVSVLPTGVDTEFFQPSQFPSRQGRIVFVGSMDWDPNEDGIAWFLRDVYPRIRQSVPHASLAVVGRNPSPRLRALAAHQPDVKLTGRVPDVRPYLAEAEVVIVPLRVGGGTRIKIPEAMAMSKAVVSTTIGAEGLPFRNSREISIADKAEDFAETVITLLRDPQMRKAIASAARNVVVEKHGWEAVVARMEEAIDAAVNSATAPEQLPSANSSPEQLYA